MAKVRGPLFSLDAVGKVGGEICFRHHAGGVHVLPLAAPGTRTKGLKPTQAQLDHQARYRAANGAWRALSPVERAEWDTLAQRTGRNVSGWNLFLKAWMAAPDATVSPALLIEQATLLLLESADGVLLLEPEA